MVQTSPQWWGKLKDWMGSPGAVWDNCKKVSCVPVVSGDMAIPDDRQRDILIALRQPLVCGLGAELL